MKKTNYIFKYIILFLIINSCKKETVVIPTVNVSVITTPISETVNKMEFLSTDSGFAICNNGKLLKTTNGGLAWNIVKTFPSTAGNLVDIKFPTSKQGYILIENKIDDDMVYRTTDGGVTWNKIIIGGSVDIKAMDFPSSSHGYLGTSLGYMYKSTNGGVSWNQITSPDFAISPFIIAFANENTGITTDYSQGKTYLTTDGGDSWTELSSSPITYCRSIFYITETEGYALGFGCIYKSIDSGLTWSQVLLQSEVAEFTICGIDVNSFCGIAVGDMSVYISENSGNNWEFCFDQNGINVNDWLTDFHFLNERNGIASSQSGTFYKIELGNKGE